MQVGKSALWEGVRCINHDVFWFLSMAQYHDISPNMYREVTSLIHCHVTISIFLPSQKVDVENHELVTRLDPSHTTVLISHLFSQYEKQEINPSPNSTSVVATIRSVGHSNTIHVISGSRHYYKNVSHGSTDGQNASCHFQFMGIPLLWIWTESLSLMILKRFD